MRDVEVVSDAIVEEQVDALRRVSLRIRSLRVPAEGKQPPLAIERTTRLEGPVGPPVVLVHGFAQNRYTWRVGHRSLSGWLADAGYDVLNLELRGHGNSRAYGAGNAASFEEYVDDLVRVVQRCESPPFVIGHSLGGGVGIGAAVTEPLAGLIHLAGVYAFGTQSPFLKLAAAATLAAEPMLRRSRMRMSTGWAGGLIAKLYGVSDSTGYWFPISGWAPGSVERELLDERLAQGFDWTSVEVWLQMAGWARGQAFPYQKAWRTCDVPLLVLAGDADTLLRPADAKICFDESGSSDRTFVTFDPFEHEVHWGHLDLVLGTRAPDFVWPTIRRWMDARA